MKIAKNVNSTFFRYLVLCTLMVLGCKESKPELLKESGETTSPLFTLLSPNETNISFQNKLVEGLNANVLVYEYLYNGGGVATGDFNGDGMIDIYFSSNMGENKFYINKGGMKFEDVRGSQLKGREQSLEC